MVLRKGESMKRRKSLKYLSRHIGTIRSGLECLYRGIIIKDLSYQDPSFLERCANMVKREAKLIEAEMKLRRKERK